MLPRRSTSYSTVSPYRVRNESMWRAAAEKFLAKYLGGRYQKAMTPEVAQRLKEITVDVKTVTLPEKTDATAGTPKPATD